MLWVVSLSRLRVAEQRKVFAQNCGGVAPLIKPWNTCVNTPRPIARYHFRMTLAYDRDTQQGIRNICDLSSPPIQDNKRTSPDMMMNQTSIANALPRRSVVISRQRNRCGDNFSCCGYKGLNKVYRMEVEVGVGGHRMVI